MDLEIGMGLALLLLLVLIAVVSLAESAIYVASRTRIRNLGEEGAEREQAAYRILQKRNSARAALSFWFLAAVLAAEVLALKLAQGLPLSPLWALILPTVGLFVLLLIMRELLPVAIDLSRSEPTALRLAAIGEALAVLSRPMMSLLALFSRPKPGTTRPSQDPGRYVTEEEIRMLVTHSTEHGELEEDTQELISSAFVFGDTIAKEVMVPRIDMICVRTTDNLSTVLDLSMGHGFSRLPVYEDTIDNIIGIVYIKDLIQTLRACALDRPLRDFLRPVYHIPESKKVDELLREMQKNKSPMAIVVDEYGGTEGLVTMEDLLEEIVGEIEDEYDQGAPRVQPQDDGSVLVDASMVIEDVNEELGVKIPVGDDFETLAGLVYELLGHVPKAGEQAAVNGLVITVWRVHRHRITQVRLAGNEGRLPAVK